jgi:hypothetical protein
MSENFNYLLALPLSQMNHVRLMSEYKNMSCAAVIRESIQKQIIEFENYEKSKLDQIRKQYEESHYANEFYYPNTL